MNGSRSAAAASSEDRTMEFMSFANSQLSATGGSGVEGQSSAATDAALQKYNNKASPFSNIGGNASGNSAAPPPAPNGRYGILQDKDGVYSELREFHHTASGISTDIATTSTLLSDLAHLVRHESHNLFNSNGGGAANNNNTGTAKMNSLVLRIKQNIESLNGRLEQAQSDLEQKKRRMTRQGQASQEASNLVQQLQLEFVRATQHFKDVLQQRSDGMKQVQDRKRAMLGGKDGEGDPNASGMKNSSALGHRPPVFGASQSFGGASARGQVHNRAAGPMLDLSSAYGKGPSTNVTPAGESTNSNSSLPRPYGITGGGTDAGPAAPTFGSPAASGLRSRHNASNAIPSFSGSTSTYYAGTSPNSFSAGGAAGGNAYTALTPIEIARMEAAQASSGGGPGGQQQSMQLIPDQSYLQDRANAMSTVESNIVELGTIFNKLATMVNEHSELVQRVEDNVDDTHSNVQLSMAALTDTLDHLRTNQGVFYKVLGVLVIFIILFVTFFA